MLAGIVLPGGTRHYIHKEAVAFFVLADFFGLHTEATLPLPSEATQSGLQHVRGVNFLKINVYR
ncbi:hypothetical protein C3433_26670 [Citrobacter freundii]|nr:hypothetical protein C3433_26670 [Citrobacter freundii]